VRIEIVTPAADADTPGNRVTADRWAGMLRERGHGVEVRTGSSPGGDPEQPISRGDGPRALPDVLVALHARKSLPAVRDFVRRRREGGRTSTTGLVVALTGTDLYRDLEDPDAEAWEAVERADRLVALQERGPDALPPGARSKTRVIYQSVPELWSVTGGRGPDRDGLEVCMLAHLRPVKDPLVATRAAELLSPDSGIRIDHFGSAYHEELAREAREASARGSGYRWHGELPRGEALERLVESDLLLVTSRLEGAGNAVSEAITARVPVLCTRIAGLEGMVGTGYPGFFPPGDARALARLLERAAGEPSYLASLREAVEARRPLLDPAREREAWAELLRELPATAS